MGVLREIIARFGIEADDSQAKKLDNSVESLVGKLQNVATLLVGGTVIQGLKSFAGELTHTGSELMDTSQQLGLSTAELQQWRFAAKLGGVEAGQFGAAMARLTLSQEAASQGSKTQAAAFKKLGVEYKDAQGKLRPVGELLPQLAEGFEKTKNQTERTGLAFDLFGRQGIKLAPIFAQGAAGLEELNKQFAELGGGMTQEAIEAADEYGDEVDKLDLSMLSLKSSIGLQLLPVFTGFVQWMAKGIGAVKEFTQNTNLLQGVMIVAAAALGKFALAVIAANAPLILAGVGLLFVVAAAEELFTLFSGEGESATQSLIDELFGVGTTAEYVEKTINALQRAWLEFKNLFTGDDSDLAKQLRAASGKDPSSDLDKFKAGLAEKRAAGTGGFRFGDEVSDDQRVSLRYGGKHEDKDKQDEALRTGDVAGYIDSRGGKSSREQAFQEYKEKLAGDAGDAGGGKMASKVEGRKGGGATKVIHMAGTQINVTAPAGTSEESMVRMVKKVIKDDQETQTRRMTAALGQGQEG